LELDLSIPDSPDSPKSVKKPTQSPLILEDLLKSFFAPEERDLSCDECKVQGSRAKVRTDRWTDGGRKGGTDGGMHMNWGSNGQIDG
jgi:hypothetical protein